MDHIWALLLDDEVVEICASEAEADVAWRQKPECRIAIYKRMPISYEPNATEIAA